MKKCNKGHLTCLLPILLLLSFPPQPLLANDSTYIPASAQYALGYMYEKGIGTSKDINKAFYYYSKSAEQGYPSAQYNVGHMHKDGIGIPKDLRRAFTYFHKAAEQDHVSAQYNLSLMYYTGEGTPKNLSKTAYWIKKASDNGHIKAKEIWEELELWRYSSRSNKDLCNVSSMLNAEPKASFSKYKCEFDYNRNIDQFKNDLNLKREPYLMISDEERAEYANDEYVMRNNRQVYEFKEYGIMVFFDLDGNFKSLTFKKPFAGTVGGVRIGDSLYELIQVRGEPSRNTSNGIIYHNNDTFHNYSFANSQIVKTYSNRCD